MRTVITNGVVLLAAGVALPVGSVLRISESERRRMDPDGFYFTDASDDAGEVAAVIGSDPVALPIDSEPAPTPTPEDEELDTAPAPEPAPSSRRRRRAVDSEPATPPTPEE